MSRASIKLCDQAVSPSRRKMPRLGPASGSASSTAARSRSYASTALTGGALTAGRIVFFARQRAFQAAAMNLDPEACFDGGEALWRRQPGAGSLEINDKGDDLGGDLVPAFGPARLGQQAGEPGRGQRVLSLVEGRPRNAKADGNVADRDTIGPMPPHHLVAHLDKISRIEEGIVGE